MRGAEYPPAETPGGPRHGIDPGPAPLTKGSEPSLMSHRALPPKIPSQKRSFAPVVVLLFLALGLFTPHLGSVRANGAASRPRQPDPGASDIAAEKNPEIQLGRLYENLGLWKEAEEHYVTGARDSSPAVQLLALSGILRVRLSLSPSTSNAAGPQHITLARLYELAGRPEDAEKHYLMALDDPAPWVQQEAFRSLGRAMHRGRTWAEFADGVGAWTLRVFIAVTLLILLVSIASHFPSATAGIDIAAFATPAEAALQGQIASSFSKVRAKLLKSALPASGLPPLRGRGANLPLLLPIDPGDLSELSVDAGGFKIAGVMPSLRLLLRPRFRITGGAHLDAAAVTFHAEIWRRWYWFGEELQDTVVMTLGRSASANGTPSGAVPDPELFVYAVFLRILYAAS